MLSYYCTSPWLFTDSSPLYAVGPVRHILEWLISNLLATFYITCHPAHHLDTTIVTLYSLYFKSVCSAAILSHVQANSAWCDSTLSPVFRGKVLLAFWIRYFWCDLILFVCPSSTRHAWQAFKFSVRHSDNSCISSDSGNTTFSCSCFM